MLIRNPADWELREGDATPEAVYMRRREILLGMAAAGLLPASAAEPATGGTRKRARRLAHAVADEHRAGRTGVGAGIRSQRRARHQLRCLRR